MRVELFPADTSDCEIDEVELRHTIALVPTPVIKEVIAKCKERWNERTVCERLPIHSAFTFLVTDHFVATDVIGRATESVARIAYPRKRIPVDTVSISLADGGYLSAISEKKEMIVKRYLALLASYRHLLPRKGKQSKVAFASPADLHSPPSPSTSSTSRSL